MTITAWKLCGFFFPYIQWDQEWGGRGCMASYGFELFSALLEVSSANNSGSSNLRFEEVVFSAFSGKPASFQTDLRSGLI